MQIAIAESGGKIPIIAGTGKNCTQTTIQETQAAEKRGANAALIVTPYYNKPTQHGLYLHYKAVAENTNLPILLYNVPSRTGCDLQTDTVVKLSSIKNIIGIKDASVDLSRVRETINVANPDFILLSGDDKTALEFIKRGGHGVISVTANVVPEAMWTLCNDQYTTQELQQLHSALMVQSNPIPVKWALHKMGKIASGIRLPLTPLDNEFHNRVTKALQAVGLLEGVECEV